MADNQPNKMKNPQSNSQHQQYLSSKVIYYSWMVDTLHILLHQLYYFQYRLYLLVFILVYKAYNSSFRFDLLSRGLYENIGLGCMTIICYKRSLCLLLSVLLLLIHLCSTYFNFIYLQLILFTLQLINTRISQQYIGMQSLNCSEKLICKILKSGVVPHHIGFIMDGNRRYAKKSKLNSTLQGHVQGVKSLKKCLLLCKQLGIEEISLFCFSVENFNRSKQQVDGLMKLCIETFNEMSTMSEMLLKQQIKVNIIGRKDKLRQDVRQSLQKIQKKTKQFSRITVNLCFAYDSIHEVQTALQKMSTPNYQNFINGLAIPHHLDLLVRTANEYRLSNFMLAQAAYAYIYILKQNWPEINIFSFIKIILSYNYHYKDIQKNRKRIQDKLGKKTTEQNTNQQQNQQAWLKNRFQSAQFDKNI